MKISELTVGDYFGTELRRLRTNANITQEELGFLSGLHRTYISLLERGKRTPTMDTFFKICIALGVDPKDVIADIEIQVNQELS